MNKKLLGTIALSFLLFGTITNNVNSKMDVRSVLSEDISETVSGERFAPKKANEVEVKEVANEVKIQQRKNENGKGVNDCSSSIATSKRDSPGGRLRPKGCVF